MTLPPDALLLFNSKILAVHAHMPKTASDDVRYINSTVIVLHVILLSILLFGFTVLHWSLTCCVVFYVCLRSCRFWQAR